MDNLDFLRDIEVAQKNCYLIGVSEREKFSATPQQQIISGMNDIFTFLLSQQAQIDALRRETGATTESVRALESKVFRAPDTKKAPEPSDEEPKDASEEYLDLVSLETEVYSLSQEAIGLKLILDAHTHHFSVNGERLNNLVVGQERRATEIREIRDRLDRHDRLLGIEE